MDGPLHLGVVLAAGDAPVLPHQAQLLPVGGDGPGLVAPDLTDVGDAHGAVGEFGGRLQLLAPAVPGNGFVIVLPLGVNVPQGGGAAPFALRQILQRAELFFHSLPVSRRLGDQIAVQGHAEAAVHGGELFEPFPCLAEPPVGDEIVQQPHVGGAVLGIAAAVVAEPGDEGVVVADAPVGDVASPGVAELADGVGIAGLFHGGLAVLHGKQPVLLGLAVVELCQQRLGLPGHGRILSDGLELLLQLPLLRLGEEAPGVDVILHPIQLLLRAHGKELVDGDAEVHGNLRQHLHVRHAVAALPFTHGLGRHMQVRRQGFLSQPSLIAQSADLFSHFHFSFLLGFPAEACPASLLWPYDSREKGKIPAPLTGVGSPCG